MPKLWARGFELEIADLIQRMEHELEPLLSEAGLELFECKVTLHRATKKVDLLIDKPQGGISLEECAQFNRKISQQMDLDECWKEFDLNVSSPGMDFPMRKAKDFKRVVGRMIRVHMKVPADGPLQFEGLLKDAQNEQIVLLLGLDEKIIGVENIQKGVQLI